MSEALREQIAQVEFCLSLCGGEPGLACKKQTTCAAFGDRIIGSNKYNSSIWGWALKKADQIAALFPEPKVEGEQLEDIARELFAVWKDAKSTEIDDWDDVTWASLPESHKREYFLTASRIIAKSAQK